MKKPQVLIVIDGWGMRPERDGNAIAQANTPTFDHLERFYPFTKVEAAGIAVGVPWTEPGNSEVGHLNIGSGQVIYQNLPRVDLALENKTFFTNEAFLGAINHAKKNDGTLHLLGLASNGGVHSHIKHLEALINLAKQEKFKKVMVHAITDGRDTPPDVAATFLKPVIKQLKKLRGSAIASISGRYYSMDRNNNWDRTAKAYQMLTKGEGEKATDPLKAIAESYKKDLKDEHILPTIITNRKEEPLGLIKPGDAVIFFNYREDRARQLTKAFVEDKFDKFERGPKIKNLYFATMMEYEEGLPVKVAFPPQHITEPLAAVISKAGMMQYHVAETEKYAHVTYFFNGGIEEPFKGEERKLIPSPAVTSYDQKPEMSAEGIVKDVLPKIAGGKYDFILINFANPDMVGHTGKFAAAKKAVETVDAAVGKIIEATMEQDGIVYITADHGNAEQMIDVVTDKIDKKHSSNPVPFILVDHDKKREKTDEELQDLMVSGPVGILADVAPTIIDLMGLKKPREMTGQSFKEYLV